MINQNYQTPNFLTGLESTKAELQSRLQTNKTERATPTLNFRPQSVQGATPFAKFSSQARLNEAQSQPQPSKITQALAKIGTGEKEVEQEDDLLQIYLQDVDQDLDSKQELMKALEEGVNPDELISHLQTNGYTGPKESFLGGVASKTGEAFKGGLGRIKEAGVGLAEGKYTTPEAFARGGAGALETAFSPISGVLGETLETGIEQVPQDFKDFIAEKTEPTIEDVKAWYDSQSPEQQRNLQNIGVGVEVLANFVGGKAIKDATPSIKTGASNAGEFISDTAKNVGKTAVEKTQAGKQAIGEAKESVTTGLSQEQIKGYKSNPYQAEEFEKLVTKMDSPEGIDDVKNYKVERVAEVTEELTQKIDDIRANKGETSKEYGKIRALDTPVDANKIQNSIETVLQKSGIEVKDGSLVRKPGIKAGVLNEADVAKFNQLYQDLKAESARQNGTITPSQTLDFRKTASELARYDGSTTSVGQNIMREVRKEIDKVAKTEIPGLKKLDAQFVDKLDEFENAVKNLVYKGGDERGDYRSNIVNIIGTLDRQNRNLLVKRLEEVMPGIRERVEAINNIPSIYKSMSDSKLTDQLLSTGGALIGASTGPLGLVVGYLVGKGVNKAVSAVRTKSIKRALSKVSPEGKKKLESINSKIAKKEKLSKLDKDFLDTFKKEINNKPKNAKLSPKSNSNTNTPNNTSSSSTRSVVTRSNSNSSNGKTKLAPKKDIPKKKEPVPIKDTPKKETPIKKTTVKKTEKKKLAPVKKNNSKSTPTTEYKIAQSIADKTQLENLQKTVKKFEENILKKYIEDIKNQGKILNTKTGKKDVFGEDEILRKHIKKEAIITNALEDVGYDIEFNKKGTITGGKESIHPDYRKYFKEEKDGDLVAKQDGVIIYDKNTEGEVNNKFMPVKSGRISKKDITEIFRKIKISEQKDVKVPIAENQLGLGAIRKPRNIQKPLQNLTTKNVYNTSNTIAKQLGVPVKKVQEVIKEFVDKYGDDIKNKLGELADAIADKTGARAKLLGGEGAKLAPKTGLAEAKSLDGKINADAIWKKTGWEKGADGKWRFEIDDSKATINNGLISGLKTAAKKSGKTKLDNVTYKKNKDGTFDVMLRVKGAETLDDIIDFKKLTEKQISELIGGDVLDNIKSGKGYDSYIGALEDAKGIDAEFDVFLSQGTSLEDILQHNQLYENYPELRRMDVAFMDDIKGAFLGKTEEGDIIILGKGGGNKSVLLHEIQHKIQNLEDFSKGGDIKKGYDIYQRLSGETEARNVQTRLGKTASERKKLSPSKTEDVPRSKQILK